MEVDESINNDEFQQRNVYGSLIDPEEPENSENSVRVRTGKANFGPSLIGLIF